MCEQVTAFQKKLGISEQQVIAYEFIHFPTFYVQSDVNELNRFCILISGLKLQFENRFKHFKRLCSHFSLFSTPVSTDINSLLGYLQMENYELECNLERKEKFEQVGLSEFYKTYLDKDKYTELYKQSEFMYLFGNTYMYKRHFSRMKLIKSKLRFKKIADEHLQNSLHIATIYAQIDLDILFSAE